MRHCILFAIVLLALCFVGQAPAAQPKPIRIRQNNQMVTFYRLKGQQYRLVHKEALTRVNPTSKVCLIIKLMGAGGQTLRPHGASLALVDFTLTSGAKGAYKPGDNMLIGGTVKTADGRSTFQVEAATVLPSDLVLFDSRWEALEENKTPQPEDYFRIGWWLSKGKAVSQGLSNQAFQSYEAKITKAYEKAMVLELEALDSTKIEDLTTRVKRYTQFVEGFGATIPDGEAAWHLEQCRTFLNETKAIRAKLLGEKPEITEEELAQLRGHLYYLAGQMGKHYHPDQSFKALYLKGGALNPSHVGLAKELRQAGYVRFENRWITQQEMIAAKRRKELAREAAERKRLEQEQAKERELARQKMLAGDGLDAIRSSVDTLLSVVNERNLKELGESLDTYPEDVARYAVSRFFSVSPAIKQALVVSFLDTAIQCKHTPVRQDTADILCHMGAHEQVTLVVKWIAQEQDETAQLHMVQALSKIPGTGGIDALLQLLMSGNVPVKAKNGTVAILEKETKQTFGADTLRWKTWWQKNRATFKRK